MYFTVIKITQIFILPYGRHFRGTGHMWMSCPGSLLGDAMAGSRTCNRLIARPAP